MKKLTLLGNITPATFLRDYWHKKPLLIRQAIPHFKTPIDPPTLFNLASQDDIEARLITRFKQQWQLENGPFTSLPPSKKKNWTLLVQGVNLHHPQAEALLRQFSFLPDARLDDLMISYASEGGGVGPHFDSYDVFLLQAHGQRRWQISAQKDLALVHGMPLKILSKFVPEQEFVLEPGDMLYLPPHYAHDGVALNECMTYSIGFRAPTYQELGEAFLQFMSDTINLPGRYADANLKPSKHTAEISKKMLQTVTDELRKIKFTRDDITIFLGEYLSSPKYTVFFEPPPKSLSPAKFWSRAKQCGIQLVPKSRMLYRGKHVFVNGESFYADAADRTLLAQLANTHVLDGKALSTSSADLQEALCLWYEDGWITLQAKTRSAG